MKKKVKNDVKEKDIRKKNMLSYFFEMFIVFILIDFLISALPSLFTSLTSISKYGSTLIGEMFYAILALIVMLLFKNFYVFTNKQVKFSKAILYGTPMLVLSIINLVSNVISVGSFSIVNTIVVFILCIFIGITEEFLCRGWLQNEFLERYSDNKKEVIKSIAYASLIFGLIHLTNIFSTTQGVFETLLQVVNAAALGFFLGVVYYKTKNIWSVIFLHAFYDFAIYIGEVNLIKDCTYGTATNSIVLINCLEIALLCAFWILSAIYIIKLTKYPKDENKKKSNGDTILVALSFIFFLLLIPFEKFIPEYDDYQVCYDYSEIELPTDYVTHYPHSDSYEIEYVYESYNYVIDDENTEDIQQYYITGGYKFKLERVNNNLVVTNENTGYSVTIDVPLNYKYDFEVIENENDYLVLLLDEDVDSKVYYSSFITKDNMNNSNEYLDNFKESFVEYGVPTISQIGYATLEGKDYKYPFFYSDVDDCFIIIENKLYLVK